MLEHLKDLAARQVGKVLASDTTMKVLSIPQVKTALETAINLPADAMQVVEKQVRDVAGRLELVTRQDVASLRRSIRELEDNLAEMREQLDDAQTEVATVRASQAQAQTHGQAASEPAAGDDAPKTAAAGSTAKAKSAKAEAGAGKASKKRSPANPAA